MDITNIQSTLSDKDIAVIESVLTNNGVDENEFKQILNNIESESKKLEKEYKNEMSIFPEHDFKKLAFENVLNEFEGKENISTTEIDSTKTDEVTASTLTVNQTNTDSETKTIPISSTNSSSTIPSVEHLSSKNKFDSIINEMSQKYNVPFNLIKLVVNTESGFNANATSRSGAMGLMQLMPATAKWLGVNNAYDPRQNIEGGTKYLNQMLKKYDGKVDLALAAYNAGPGNVDKYKGIPPFKETQNYVKKILG